MAGHISGSGCVCAWATSTSATATMRARAAAQPTRFTADDFDTQSSWHGPRSLLARSTRRGYCLGRSGSRCSTAQMSGATLRVDSRRSPALWQHRCTAAAPVARVLATLRSGNSHVRSMGTNPALPRRPRTSQRSSRACAWRGLTRMTEQRRLATKILVADVVGYDCALMSSRLSFPVWGLRSRPSGLHVFSITFKLIKEIGVRPWQTKASARSRAAASPTHARMVTGGPTC